MPDILAMARAKSPANAECAFRIGQLIHQAGGRAFLVGGGVRDAMRGVPPVDLDMELYGLSAEQIIELLSREFTLNLVGMSFGVIKISGVDVDVSLPRRENKTGRGHRGFLITPDSELSPQDASARRDFTVNAMMWDVFSGELLDFHGGMNDLQNGILRHVSPAFVEDPLRVLRGMQFLARFKFSPAPELIELCQSMTPEGLAVERVGAEWEKLLLQGLRPSAGLDFLEQCNWLDYYPELAALNRCPQYPKWHPEGNVWRHTLHCLDAAAELRTGKREDDRIMMLAVLCHDLGKPATTVFEQDGRITSRGHEEAGADPTRSFIARLWRDAKLADQVVPLVENHLKPYSFFSQKASDKAIRRLALKVKRLDLLLAVAQSDSAGRPPTPVDMPPLEWFRHKIEELKVADAAPEPLIKGRHLIAFGMKPGRELGEMVHRCYEAQLDGEFDSPESANAYLHKLFSK